MHTFPACGDNITATSCITCVNDDVRPSEGPSCSRCVDGRAIFKSAVSPCGLLRRCTPPPVRCSTRDVSLARRDNARQPEAALVFDIRSSGINNRCSDSSKFDKRVTVRRGAHSPQRRFGKRISCAEFFRTTPPHQPHGPPPHLYSVQLCTRRCPRSGRPFSVMKP